MSENEKIEEEEDIPTRKLLVKVDSSKIDDIVKERDQLKEMLSKIADEEIEKLRDKCRSLVSQDRWGDIDEIADPFQLEAYYEGLRKSQPKSSGIVTFHSTKEITGSPEFETADEYGAWLYEQANNPESRFYEGANQALRLLWKKNPIKNLGSQKFEFASGLEAEAIRALGKNFSHTDYTNWVRKRSLREKK